MPTLETWKSMFADRRLLLMAMFGFSSGLPVALTAGTLQAWLTDSGLDIKTIGLLTLVGQPYFYKFLWAPLMDRFAPPLISGRRRSWLLATQLALMLCLFFMGDMNPAEQPWLLAGIAMLVAFVSASQDIVVDAYRTEILSPEERPAGTALFVSFWRIAAIVSGAGALLLADQWGWEITYMAMAALILVGIIATFLAEEPKCTKLAERRTLQEAIVLPLKDFLQRDQAIVLLLFVVLYKLADAFAAQLMTAFFVGGADIQGLGFTKTEVGLIAKGWGVAATIIGASVAALWMKRLNLFNALLIFGVFQAVSNLMFVWLAVVGKNHSLLIATVFIENFCSGLGTTAFLTLLMALCNQTYAVSQYALLSAFAAVGARFLGPLAGWLVDQVGWVLFFVYSFISAFPAFVLLFFLKQTIEKYGKPKKSTEKIRKKKTARAT